MPERLPPLARLIGAQRYLSLHAFLFDYPVVLPLVLASFVLFILFSFGWLGIHDQKDDAIIWDDFVEARVLSSWSNVSNDGAQFSMWFVVEAPRGDAVAIKTTDLARAMTVTDTACLHHGTREKTGAEVWFLTQHSNC